MLLAVRLGWRCGPKAMREKSKRCGAAMHARHGWCVGSASGTPRCRIGHAGGAHVAVRGAAGLWAALQVAPPCASLCAASWHCAVLEQMGCAPACPIHQPGHATDPERKQDAGSLENCTGGELHRGRNARQAVNGRSEQQHEMWRISHEEGGGDGKKTLAVASARLHMCTPSNALCALL